MQVSAPYLIANITLASSPSMSLVTAELPRLALILHLVAMPMPIGSRRRWWIFAGITSRPRATSLRISSAARPSRSATRVISSVMMPRLA